MSTKTEIQDELKALGVDFDPTANKETLEALLETHKNPAGAASATPKAGALPAAAADNDEVEVGDPMSLRPVDLPLVVKPKGKVDAADPLGGWKNEEQAKFAATLNAHAYQFPRSWAAKKDKLVSQLVEIGNNPELFYQLAGEQRDPNAPSTKINDKRVGQGN
jgi:hypothetical protein